MHLPNFPLDAGFASRRLHDEGCTDFHATIRWVHALPYGRNIDRADFSLVLSERRGTCSTKHAFLAALARDSGVHVTLRVGVYLMTGNNTPGIAAALDAHGFAQVPEAHCYLYDGHSRVDFTFPDSDGACELELLAEKDIAPEDIGDAKVAWHRAFVTTWAEAEGHDPRAVWSAREACIAALGARRCLRGNDR